ncbi:hypothetical protein FZI91_13115 [Mycobacterium sp. CBMA271]|nr:MULTISPECIES: hypothetical protein [unclassified Mycobacteroides]MUM18673.1 hypothetical protein [Mycobacteroides sp. CBMA 326]MUM22635.1 hypothetical protein [Mycobacteroides sp. CBMA 271]
MLIVALVLAAIGLAALVTAVVTSNEVLAFVCIAAAAVGVVLMIIDAIRDRHTGALDADEEPADGDEHDAEDAVDHPEDAGDFDEPEGVAAAPESAEPGDYAKKVSPAAAAVSLKEAATSAHIHSSAEETYEQFDVDDEDEDEPHRR